MGLFNWFSRKRAYQPTELDIELQKLHFEGNRMDGEFKSDEVSSFMASFGDAFIKSGAPNFISMKAWHPEIGWFEVIAQKTAGKSVADVAAERLRRIEELESLLGNPNS